MKSWQQAIKTKFLYFLLASFFCQICFAPAAKSQNFTFNDGRTKDVLAFDFIKNLIVIPVYINNKGPFNFILDTGVGPMVITNPKLIDSIGLTGLRQVKIAGFGGGDEMFANVARTSVTSIGEASVKDLMIFVLKEDVFNLSSYVGKEIAGLVGHDFFKDFIVKVNYPTQRITFSSPGKNDKIRGEKIPFELINNKPYISARIQTEALGKIGVKLIVDCGASHALSLETYNDKVFQPSAVNIQGNLGIGLSGPINGHIGRTPTLGLGNFTFKNVLTNFPTYNEIAKTNFKERNGNLGADILKRFHVTFDYQHKVMYLQKNEFFKRPFEHDMSGMELYMSGAPDHYCLLGRIEPDSPAEKADFHLNDQIISINLRAIEDFSLDEVSALFKSGDGRVLIIEILRDKKILVKLLKLRKRV
ncbi:MAG: aspartyl protease family protein [Pedobacter sp.]|nr:aspartyl protease family protein [Pedobacter sp.]MDQ8052514.1 aspartyl protease family protein [Pedobacter sp.]